ncbi:MAG TPA: hypothetical protein VMN60_08730 [Longimicrobiales bacterium]|nr:hypothetical protein [Longimicrobiales bacterium]
MRKLPQSYRRDEVDPAAGPAPAPPDSAGTATGAAYFSGQARATDEDLYDLRVLRETLEEILASGRVARRPKRGEATAADGLVYAPVTAAERTRWTSMVAQVRAEETRVRLALEGKGSTA